MKHEKDMSRQSIRRIKRGTDDWKLFGKIESKRKGHGAIRDGRTKENFVQAVWEGTPVLTDPKPETNWTKTHSKNWGGKIPENKKGEGIGP